MYAALIQGQESRLNNSLAIFDTVNGYITDTVLKRVSDFRARWILAVRWINVCPYGDDCRSVSQINDFCIHYIFYYSSSDRAQYFPMQYWLLMVPDHTPSTLMSVDQLNWVLNLAGIGFSASWRTSLLSILSLATQVLLILLASMKILFRPATGAI